MSFLNWFRPTQEFKDDLTLAKEHAAQAIAVFDDALDNLKTAIEEANFAAEDAREDLERAIRRRDDAISTYEHASALHGKINALITAE